jgi:phosphoheptose isomerase
MAVNATRRASARIAVTGAGAESTAARAYVRAELDGIRFVAPGGDDGAAVAGALHDVDVLVFLASAGERPNAALIAKVAEAAHERGVLVAALLVGDERGGASPLLAALRDAADMVMVVHDPDDARAVIAALR